MTLLEICFNSQLKNVGNKSINNYPDRWGQFRSEMKTLTFHMGERTQLVFTVFHLIPHLYHLGLLPAFTHCIISHLRAGNTFVAGKKFQMPGQCLQSVCLNITGYCRSVNKISAETRLLILAFSDWLLTGFSS